MALFKISKGLKANLPSAKTVGNCWYTIDDSLFYIDYEDVNGEVQRKALNAKDAETLSGVSLSTLLSEVDGKIEIAISEIPEQVQSDWSVNDETNPAYINNRICYIADPAEKTLVETQSVIIDSNNGYEQLMEMLRLTEGEMYIVYFDDDRYECTAWTSSGVVCLGDGSAFGYGSRGNGEPFCISSYQSGAIYLEMETAGTYTLSIAQITSEVHTIDEQFLPHSALIGSGATGEYAEIFNDYENNIASGKWSHAEGRKTTASDQSAHAEGEQTTASGSSSHSEGFGTIASEECTHAEGNGTQATARCAHSEGFGTVASGKYSHAEGQFTLASSEAQHTQGKYNIEDTLNKYAHIVGNGTETNARSNAHTLSWDGTAWFAKTVKVGGTNQDDAQELVTQAYVDAIIDALRPKSATVSLSKSNWAGIANPYSQVVTINGVTANSKIDLQPTAAQIISLKNEGVAMVAENDNGTVTIYALGNKPSSDYTMQVLLTEVTPV